MNSTWNPNPKHTRHTIHSMHRIRLRKPMIATRIKWSWPLGLSMFIRPLPLNREPIETLKMWAFNGTVMMYCAYWHLMDRNPEDIWSDLISVGIENCIFYMLFGIQCTIWVSDLRPAGQPKRTLVQGVVVDDGGAGEDGLSAQKVVPWKYHVGFNVLQPNSKPSHDLYAHSYVISTMAQMVGLLVGLWHYLLDYLLVSTLD